MRDSPELHWSTQAGTSSSVRDPYPACGLIFHRRPLSGLPPHSCGERRIKRWRDCGRYRHRCRAWHQKQRQSGTEMPKFCLGNYAFFGVGEPAACGAGVVTVPFAVVACCNAFPRPQRDDAERGEGATQPDADTPLSCDVCAWLWYCVITSSAIPHGYTP